jgi:membrane protein DedA with SNARE-associated domain
MEWLRQNEGPLAYLVLLVAGGLEYVFPPLPGDAITLFGAFLAATADYHPALVYAAIWVGSMMGAMSAYALGRSLSRRKGRDYPRWLRGKRMRAALGKVEERFEKHGAVYLALNRFIPALRAVFFIGAGIAGLPAWKVFLWGGISAALWNALLLGAGYAVGNNWDRLETLATRYTLVVVVLLAAAAAGALVVWLIRRRRRPA